MAVPSIIANLPELQFQIARVRPQVAPNLELPAASFAELPAAASPTLAGTVGQVGAGGVQDPAAVERILQSLRSGAIPLPAGTTAATGVPGAIAPPSDAASIIARLKAYQGGGVTAGEVIGGAAGAGGVAAGEAASGVPAAVDGAVGAAGATGEAAPVAEVGGGLVRGLVRKLPGIADDASLLAKGGLLKTAGTIGAGALAGDVAAGLLDKTGLTGRKGTDPNNLIDKILKYGGAGAGAGAAFDGVGAIPGALIGGAVGAGHFALEKLGILGGSDSTADATKSLHRIANKFGAFVDPDTAAGILQAYQVASIAADESDDPEAARTAAKNDAIASFQQAALQGIGQRQQAKLQAAQDQQNTQRDLAIQGFLVQSMAPYLHDLQQSGQYQAAMFNNLAGGVSDRNVANGIRAQGAAALNGANNLAGAFMFANQQYPIYDALKRQNDNLQAISQQVQQQAQAAVAQRLLGTGSSGSGLTSLLANTGG
jgi:hypothetical protein